MENDCFGNLTNISWYVFLFRSGCFKFEPASSRVRSMVLKMLFIFQFSLIPDKLFVPCKPPVGGGEGKTTFSSLKSAIYEEVSLGVS